MRTTYSIGIDLGSVSTNLAALEQDGSVAGKVYIRTGGNPATALRQGLGLLREQLPVGAAVTSVGTTGSGRQLAGVLIGADSVKNEITAHSVAALVYAPEVRTIIEIGGQDSKLIILEDGVPVDFAMNTVCAAGTGSFLDRQAARIGIPVEELGDYALRSGSPVRIAGRCAVFAESDMIHKQQSGHSTEDIVAGLCDALVRTFLSGLAKGKRIEQPILFQGGVAANKGIVAAFEKQLGMKVTVPVHHDIMGAIGAARIAARELAVSGGKTSFGGWDCVDGGFAVNSTECPDCPNRCEVVQICRGGEVSAHWGDKCGKWANKGGKAV